jgi:hypothetical protein
VDGRVDVWLMMGLSPVTAMVAPTQGTSLTLWEGTLAVDASRTLTVPVRAWWPEIPLRMDALFSDGSGQRWERRLWLDVKAWRVYLPLVLRE